MIRFGIVGGGWRTEFFLRIAQALPERFEVTGIVTRSEEKGAALTKTWGVPTVRTPEELLAAKPDFMVLSVPWPVTPELIIWCAERGMPVLAETPPAPTEEALRTLWERVGASAKVQIAEQYPFQPHHAARIAIARSGKLGTVTQAQVSAVHGYHGMALIRRYLDTGFEPVTIRAQKFTSPILSSPGRSGGPTEEKVVPSGQTLAWLSFESGKLGVFDFTGDQYFSYIRGQRVLVRGERGEICDETVRLLLDYKTPVALSLRREDAGHRGNLEGAFHKGYSAGTEWVYQNPFPLARLADDEIAIAECLVRMAEYATGGPGYYGLAEGCHDHYLGILMDRAAASGETVTSAPVPWG